MDKIKIHFNNNKKILTLHKCGCWVGVGYFLCVMLCCVVVHCVFLYCVSLHCLYVLVCLKFLFHFVCLLFFSWFALFFVLFPKTQSWDTFSMLLLWGVCLKDEISSISKRISNCALKLLHIT